MSDEMKIKLSVQHKQAVDALKKTEKGIEKLGDESKKSTGAMERMRIKTSGMRRSIGALRNNLLLVSFAFGGTVAAIQKMVSSFGEQELAEKKLSTALGHTSQSLLDQASALQKVTTFGDESIITAQALIAAFTDDEATIKEATKATLDLAAAKGMDLNSAADLVSKTLGSSTNALSRYGIEVTGAVGSTQRLDSLTKNIAKTFGGQATAQAQTFTGSMKQMANVTGDVMEVIGEKIAPAIQLAAQGFTGAAEAVIEYLTALKTLTGDEIENTTDIDLLLANMNRLENQISDINNKWHEYRDSALPGLHATNEQLPILEERLARITAQYEKQQNLLVKTTMLEANAITDVQTRKGAGAEEYLASLQKIVPLEMKELTWAEAMLDTTIQSGKVRAAKSKDELKATAKSAQSASQAMKQVVRSESMEAIAGLISSIFKSVPFPFNLLAAAGAGGLANSIITKGLDQVPNFATGADFVTNGPQMMMVGEGSGPERVQVTPLVDPNINGPQGSSVTVNISAPLVDETVVDHIIPAISEAVRRGEDIGIG
jgi:hypothetical protein